MNGANKYMIIAIANTELIGSTIADGVIATISVGISI